MEGFKLTFLDAEVVTVELVVALLDRVIEHDLDYVHYLGGFYLTLRVGWYIYSKVREIKKDLNDGKQ